MKRRFDGLASKIKLNSEKLRDMHNHLEKVQSSVKAIEVTVQAEQADELSEEALGFPFTSMDDADKALSDAGKERRLLQFVSTLDKNSKFIQTMHNALLDPDLLKRCFVSNKP